MYFPINKAISPKLWKHLGVGAALLLTSAGILAGGALVAIHGDAYGPGFVSLFDLHSANAINCFNAAMLLAFAQLCLLDGWIRSRSVQNSGSTYRVWFGAGLAGFIGAAAVATQGHVALAQTIEWLGISSIPYPQTLPWLIPTAVVGLAVLALLHREMQGSNLSRVALYGAAAALVGGLLRPFEVQLPVSELQAELIHAALPMLGFLCLAMSVELHARHLVYRSDAPPRSKSESKPESKSMWSRFGRSKAATEPAKPQGGMAPPPHLPRGVKSGKKHVVEESEQELAGITKVPQKPVSASRAAEEQLRQELRALPPKNRKMRIDPAMLKGLSKRERKTVRKQLRDEHRAEKTRDD